jgi:hypothetical protein
MTERFRVGCSGLPHQSARRIQAAVSARDATLAAASDLLWHRGLAG